MDLVGFTFCFSRSQFTSLKSVPSKYPQRIPPDKEAAFSPSPVHTQCIHALNQASCKSCAVASIKKALWQGAHKLQNSQKDWHNPIKVLIWFSTLMQAQTQFWTSILINWGEASPFMWTNRRGRFFKWQGGCCIIWSKKHAPIIPFKQ